MVHQQEDLLNPNTATFVSFLPNCLGVLCNNDYCGLPGPPYWGRSTNESCQSVGLLGQIIFGTYWASPANVFILPVSPFGASPSLPAIRIDTTSIVAQPEGGSN